MKYAGTSTSCAGRSLSSAHGSVAVPMVNGPPGTSTSPVTAARARGGGGASSTGAPTRSWWVASMVSSCCCSCCTIMPKANPSVDQPAARRTAPRPAGRRPCPGRYARTPAPRPARAAAAPAGLLRGCLNASYSSSMSWRTGSRPPTSRTSHSSSWLPTCARSQTSGDISGECWRIRSPSSTASVSSAVRARVRASSAATRSRSRSVSSGHRSPFRARRFVGAGRRGRSPPRGRWPTDRSDAVPEPSRRAAAPRPWPAPGRRGPAAAASSQRSATGSHASRAASSVSSPPNSAASTATGANQSGPGCSSR